MTQGKGGAPAYFKATVNNQGSLSLPANTPDINVAFFLIDNNQNKVDISDWHVDGAIPAGGSELWTGTAQQPYMDGLVPPGTYTLGIGKGQDEQADAAGIHGGDRPSRCLFLLQGQQRVGKSSLLE